MFVARSDTTGEDYFVGFNEDTALLVAIKRATLRGETVVVFFEGEARWVVEPDTKVDDDDPTFPVIVHFREST